jgi:hypothetical protein
MAATSNSTIFLRTTTKKHHQINRCSICGKELKNVKRRTENPLACWACLIVGVVDIELFFDELCKFPNRYHVVAAAIFPLSFFLLLS